MRLETTSKKLAYGMQNSLNKKLRYMPAFQAEGIKSNKV